MILADHDYRQESFVVLNFLNLSKTISDKASFIDVNISIHIPSLIYCPLSPNECSLFSLSFLMHVKLFVHAVINERKL
jgi:hypothetical protein